MSPIEPERPRLQLCSGNNGFVGYLESIVRFLTSETAPNRRMVGLTRAATANTVPASTNETYLILAIGIVYALFTIA